MIENDTFEMESDFSFYLDDDYEDYDDDDDDEIFDHDVNQDKETDHIIDTINLVVDAVVNDNKMSKIKTQMS